MPSTWVGIPLLPEIVLAVLALLIIVLDAAFWPRRLSQNLGYLMLCGLLLVLSAALQEWTYGVNGTAFDGLIFFDAYATLVDLLVLAVALCALLLALSRSDREKQVGEFYPLLLISVLGMMLAVSAANMLIVYLGLELASLPLWMLVTVSRGDGKGLEAGVKMLIISLFGSGLMLFGTALLYGAAGGTGLQLLVDSLSTSVVDDKLVMPGVGLVVAGLLLKIGAAPFHAWSPDVREGSPLAVSAFVAAAVPAAGCAVLGRVMLFSFASVEHLWMPLLEVTAVLSVVCGSLQAINQRNIKRLLAYVGVAQVGVALVGLLATNEAGLAGLFFCFFGSALALAGCYAVIAMCGPGSPDLRDYCGLARQQPLLALGFAFCLASLAGLPPTAGFIGRLYVLMATLEAGRVGLALVAAGCFPFLAYAGLRVARSAIMNPPDVKRVEVHLRAESLVVLLLSLMGTLTLGLMPAALLRVIGETVTAVL